jgi:hypothetical protein
MDASDIINRKKEKTIYLNISALLSTTQVGSTPGKGGLASNTVYNFPSYDLRQDYFVGRYEAALVSTPGVTCSTLSVSYQ